MTPVSLGFVDATQLPLESWHSAAVSRAASGSSTRSSTELAQQPQPVASARCEAPRFASAAESVGTSSAVGSGAKDVGAGMAPLALPGAQVTAAPTLETGEGAGVGAGVGTTMWPHDALRVHVMNCVLRCSASWHVSVGAVAAGLRRLR